MPRTKASKAVPKPEKEEISRRKQILEDLKQSCYNHIETVRATFLKQIEEKYVMRKLKIPDRYHKMTVEEIKCMSSFSTTCTSSTVLLSETAGKRKAKRSISANSTAVLSENSNRRNPKRSVSCNSDDGYLTTDSNSTGSRHSRSRAKKPTLQSTRVSRSLSRADKKTAPFKTPVNKNTPPNSYGVVTPKCKPNTPQVLLRRPKQGEMALSMAGSPLLAAPMITEQTANINIPISDGNLLSIQPQRGLRLSQIPALDKDTLRQLQLLHENLAKIVEVQAKH